MTGFSLADAYTKAADVLKGDALPPNDYDVRVKSAKEKMTQGGKLAFGLVLEVTSGPYAGRTIPDQLTWSPESDIAMRIFHQSLTVLGASQQWVMSNSPTNEQIAARITGATVRVQVAERDWNGQSRNDVRYRNQITGTAVPSLDGNSGNGATGDSSSDDEDTPWPL